MAGKTIGKQAVVIGAGMSGLAAAGALADHFERVIVLERDRLPSQAVPRTGTPQSRHLHVLLPGGQRALTDLFPHFERDLTNAGSVPLRMARDIRMEIPGLGPLPPRDFGWFIHCASRPLIELVTRRQVERIANVTIRPECRVLEITTVPDGTMVTGVAYEDADGRREILAADLVVDASGRAAPTLGLLRSSGQPAPDEIAIGIDLHYTTTSFVIPQDAPTDWRGVATWPHAPERTHGGYMMPIEGNRWLMTLAGQCGEQAPDEPEGFMDYARTLETQTIYNAIKHAERNGEFERYAFQASVWRRFDRLGAFPRLLLPIGDSICRFNPVYGQGMSVAAQEARLLNQILKGRAAEPDPFAELAQLFFSETLPLLDATWNMSAVPDLAYPKTRGDRPADLESQLQYNKALFQAAIRHPAVHCKLAEVQQLLEPPRVLQNPAIDRLVQIELSKMAADAKEGHFLNFGEKLDEIVSRFLVEESLDGIIGALELKLIALREQECDVTRALTGGPTGKLPL
ncbi:FAD-dependent monooxygenase [Bradyrhizobium sp. Ai1a-2]|uniref:NAD(P)/FAD-dependent oxidoreductase n=1 Tax=Bradyrhizobium sp. Ai1a-2 TaxID=196490 RepID=UPI0004255F22|nr:FAD-dependent monooxygenase [Bradyrhizobium sp. Ai1a-2]